MAPESGSASDNEVDRRDVLFLRFVRGMTIVMALFGAGTLIVILTGEGQTIELRMVSVFAAMFSGILGLGAGYLLGRGAG